MGMLFNGKGNQINIDDNRPTCAATLVKYFGVVLAVCSILTTGSVGLYRLGANEQTDSRIHSLLDQKIECANSNINQLRTEFTVYTNEFTHIRKGLERLEIKLDRILE